jgi:hypothetical protein
LGFRASRWLRAAFEQLSKLRDFLLSINGCYDLGRMDRGSEFECEFPALGVFACRVTIVNQICPPKPRCQQHYSTTTEHEWSKGRSLATVRQVGAAAAQLSGRPITTSQQPFALEPAVVDAFVNTSGVPSPTRPLHLVGIDLYQPFLQGADILFLL